MHKNQDPNKCKLAILNKIGMKTRKIERTVYQLTSGNKIMIKYSRPHKNKPYWFGISKSKIEKFPPEKLFIVLVCDTQTEPDVIVLPATYLLKFLDDIEQQKMEIGKSMLLNMMLVLKYQLKVSKKKYLNT